MRRTSRRSGTLQEVFGVDLGGQNTDALPDDQRVYTVRTDGKVHAFDGRSGKKLWDTFPARNDTPKLDFSDGELVMTTGGGRFQALEASSGEVRWTSRDVKDVSMIIGAAPGRRAARLGRRVEVNPAAMLRGYSDLVTLHPPEKSKVLYGIDAAMKLLALDPDDGRTLWSKSTELPPDQQ